MAYARPDMAGIACSEHVLRVVPDPENIPPGYLYAYLSSKFGVPLVISGTYGAIIQHIEPEHISSLPVPRFDKSLELDVHNKIEDAAKLLSEYQRQLSQSTKDVFESVGLKDITASEWHKSGSDVGFLVEKPKVWSFRALNYNPRYLELVKHIKSVPNKSLDEICLPGSVARGGRFKRIDAAPDHAYRMIGQKELFWLKPEGRWVARTAMDIESLGIPYATMVAAQGTLGESEMYCRAEFVYGSWTEMAFSEHILRIVADEKIMPRGFLFAYMRSETVFRILRSISVGSKLQDHHYKLRGEIPVPFPDHDIQLAIHKRVIDAYEKRHRAMALMDEAVQLVERYIGRNEH
jgi:type I restriction enzyme S subunit